MANAPELVPQEADDEVDELTAALEGTQETEKSEAEESTVETTKKEEGEGEEGEVKTEEQEGETKAEEESSEVDPLEEMRLENRELRSILRQTKKDMSLLKAQVGRADQKATAALDEDGEMEYREEFTPVEQLTSAIQQIGDERGAQLDLLAETMSEMNKYADIYDVCSPDNFADMFDAIGRGIAQEQGISLEEAALRAEYTVWQQKNPYKYMYGLIKEHHPKFAKTETTPVAKPTAEAKEGKPGKKPAEAPASIAGMGGGDTSKSGWTAARIDALPEEELDKVPADVYKKYMQGTLK